MATKNTPPKPKSGSRGTRLRGSAHGAPRLKSPQRKRPEEARRESETRLRDTMDGMLEGCQIMGFDWRYLYVNDVVARYARRAIEDLLGHTMMEMYPGIEETEMFGYFRRCMEQRLPHRMETEFIFPDGDRGWFELSIQPVPEGIFILSLDMTGRKQAEDALRESEERFRVSLMHSPAGVFQQDMMLRYTWIYNPIPGFTVEGIVGKTDAELVSPEDAARLTQLKRQVLASGVGARQEIQNTVGGHVIYHDITVEPLRDKTGAVVGITGAYFDITERKQAEDALRESEERFRVSLMHTPVVVFQQDMKLRYIWVHNPAPGFAVEGILGKTDAELLSPEDGSRLMQLKRQVLTSGVGTRQEIQVTAGGHMVCHDLTIEPLRDDTGAVVGVTGASFDITERKRTEEALQRAREELEGRVELHLARAGAHGLTFRELTVLHLVAEGKSDKEIAIRLCISHLTVSKHVANILAKMNAESRTEVGVRAVREGLIG